MGGKSYQCEDCGEIKEVHHSCGDRHCPQCSGCKRYDFAARAEQLILDKVVYYQVVFTLPQELSELALSNRDAIAELLFESAGKVLRKTIRTEQGYEFAAMMVLHTWNQQLQPHWHVHALVPGGGPSLTSDSWKSAEAPAGAINSDDYYLVDAIRLRETYRKYCISKLRRLFAKGELKFGEKHAELQESSKWQAFCDRLSTVDWVSYIQPPPTQECSADQVVRYLTRYLTGGPISESRIVAADSEQVTFLAREGTRVGGERLQVPVTLSTMEFVRRWCLHIQPDQLTKTRYYGGWSCRYRTQYQSRCRRLLGQDGSATQADTAIESAGVCDSDEVESESPSLECASCGGRSLRYVSQTPKPSWSELLSHLDPRCPSWYAEHEYDRFCEELDREYGISYEDWYLESGIESTIGSSGWQPLQSPPPLQQLYFPGLSPKYEYWIESY